MSDDKFVKTIGHFFHEIESVFNTIKETKEEISLIGQNEIQEKYIADANNQLDAIVSSTEEASNSIMEAVEQIEEIIEKNENFEDKDAVFSEITKIFEACSFQDLTGQRIGKVVHALQKIEKKVENVMKIFSKEIDFVQVNSDADNSEQPQENAFAEEGSSLEGPQLPGQGNEQDIIDQIMNGKK